MHDHTHSHLQHLLLTIDPLDIMGFIAIFSLSFASSLHCGLMCGPLVCSSLNNRVSLNRMGIWLYNLGRIFSYSLMGALLGYFGQNLTLYLPNFANFLAQVAGIVLISLGLKKLFEIRFKRPVRLLLPRVVNFIPTSLGDFSLGVFTVLLPCMTLTPALTCAAMMGSTTKGALLMFAFSLGTLPIMLSVSLAPMHVYRGISLKYAKPLTGSFLIMTGIITLLR